MSIGKQGIEVAAGGVDSGVIALWHGTIANIPTGWLICDGNNSTPNLLTKFVQGVATAATDPGATGGEATHTLSEAELAAHTHSEYMENQIAGETHAAEHLVGSNNADDDWLHAGGSAGSGSAHENEPTFYDVAFLMKS